ncbi:MAG: FAD-dependent oxidoreductase, partial [Gemmatimonadetes bacterium]|nr:FAD-dependent oxidoreductase [Gemmatimonadota bacterium]
MRRNLPDLQLGSFDLIVIGGGIYGACAAWDAAQRGLSVALVERDDFGAATSANSYKIIHGGIRYVQHGDVKRVRSSSAERRAFLRNAPHLVKPLPIVVPTYGRAMKGRLALKLGMSIYDALTPDRNRGISDPDHT